MLLLCTLHLDHCCYWYYRYFQFSTTYIRPPGDPAMCRGNYKYLIVFKIDFRTPSSINQTTADYQTEPHVVVIGIYDHLIIVITY